MKNLTPIDHTVTFKSINFAGHFKECALEAILIDAPIAYILSNLPVALASGAGYIVSCSLGKIANEYSQHTDYNMAAVVAARAVGSSIKYALVSMTGKYVSGKHDEVSDVAESSTLLYDMIRGAINGGLYGAAGKIEIADELLEPVLIEVVDSALQCILDSQECVKSAKGHAVSAAQKAVFSGAITGSYVSVFGSFYEAISDTIHSVIDMVGNSINIYDEL